MKAVGKQKQCSRCNRVLALKEFYKDKRRPDGLRVQCKDCEKDYASQNADRIATYNKKYREENKERLKETRRTWVENNREGLREKKRAYNQLPEVVERMTDIRRRHYEENKEEYLTSSAEWKAAHPEKVRESQKSWKERNKEKIKDSRARYNRENPETVIGWSQRRRAKQAKVTIGEVNFKRIWKRDKGICYLCGRPINKNDVHYDHVVPLSRGGAHSEDNLRVTHSRCNLIKGTRLLEELDMDKFRE